MTATPWDWTAFGGDPVELKWNRKDLESLAAVVKLCRSRRVAVQAGGCLGVFAKYLAGMFDTVYTFEPSPELFPYLVNNAWEKNIVRFQAALGNRHEMVNPVCSLRPDDGKTVLHAGMTRMETGSGVVPVLRLDDLMLPFCDLIYLDVEGWELFAVQGAERTIGAFKPVVAMEMNRGMRYLGLTEDDVHSQMRLLDYEPHEKHRSDTVFLPRKWGTL